jgi:hypothetical protein
MSSHRPRFGPEASVKGDEFPGRPHAMRGSGLLAWLLQGHKYPT